jgi:uncharacterized membrane protein YbhN (UPF0104 family)
MEQQNSIESAANSENRRASGRSLAQWSWAASIPLAAALLYWSFRGVDWRSVWHSIASAKPAYLFGAAAITTFSCFMRAVRWRILLNAEGRLRVGTVFRATMVGYLGNNFLPARAGEVLRSVLISRESELTKTYVLTTAMSERLMDVIAVVMAASLALFGVNPKPRWLADISGSLLAAVVAGAVAVAVLPHTGNLIVNIIEHLPLPDRLRHFLLATSAQVLLGLRAFHHWGRMAGFAGLTALVWSADGVSAMVGARALGLTIPFPLVMLLLAAMALGSALPSTPGYVGIYQFAAVLVLVPAGIHRDQALAYSFLFQAVGYAVIVALGVPALYTSRRAARETAGRTTAVCQ